MIEFDLYPGIDEEIIKELFNRFLKYIRKEDINYIEICDKDQGYIYINKKGPENEWEEVTLQMVDLLNRLGFNASTSDEDYGYIDVIVLNDIW